MIRAKRAKQHVVMIATLISPARPFSYRIPLVVREEHVATISVRRAIKLSWKTALLLYVPLPVRSAAQICA